MNSVAKSSIPVLLAIAGLIGGVLLSLYLNKPDDVAHNDIKIPGLLWPNPKQITDFQLIDQHSNTFNLEKLKGQWSMLFFGYTHCPDVCPTTMTLLDSLSKDLADSKWPAPQVIFVTIDPERDTQKQLSEYVNYFNPSFTGLTGSQKGISTLTKQLGILSIKVPGQDTDSVNDYLMDHSSSILLVDPEARLVAIFSAPHDEKEMKHRYLAIRDFIDQHS